MLPLIPNNHVTNSLDPLHNIQENLDLLHKIRVDWKQDNFTPKTQSIQIEGVTDYSLKSW